MRLQRKILLNRSKEEYFSMPEDIFPYLTALGILISRKTQSTPEHYHALYLPTDANIQDSNFQLAIMETVTWHWHSELEFCYIVKGSCRFYIPNQVFTLHAGEAIFINSNCLHMVENTNPEEGTVYHTQLFKKEILIGPLQSVFEEKYISPILHNPQLQAVFFGRGKADIAQHMEAAFLTYLTKSTGYELLVRNYLSEFWLYLFENHLNPISPCKQGDEAINERIKSMIRYIEHNYMDKITVADIGESANVSERECLRCFKRHLKTSPFTYLTEFRLHKAAELLVETSQNILSISESCGFSSSSYFGKVFFKHMGTTPSDYRKNR